MDIEISVTNINNFYIVDYTLWIRLSMKKTSGSFERKSLFVVILFAVAFLANVVITVQQQEVSAKTGGQQAIEDVRAD